MSDTPEEPRAERTTPLEARFVAVDDSRTFLVFGAFVESMIGASLGHDPVALVRADLTGKWNHGSKDSPVLIVGPDVAREWGQTLLEAADAAEADLERYRATGEARATTEAPLPPLDPNAVERIREGDE